MGFGALGLASLLAKIPCLAPTPTPPLTPGAQAAAFARQGQARHPHFCRRRALPSRYLGPQTRPGPSTTASPSADAAWPCLRPSNSQRHGRSGIEVSEVFPKLAEHVDDMAIIRSMYTDIPAHEIATVMMNTGSRQIPKPCLGSWSLYGLGTENQNMPGFISLHTGGGLPARRHAELGLGLFARRLSGHQHQHLRRQRGQDDRKHQQPVRLRSRTAPPIGPDPSTQRTPRPGPAKGRPTGSPHRSLRNRLQNAGRRLRRLQSPQGTAKTSATCTAHRRKAARCSSPGACWNAASASSRSGPAAGTITRIIEKRLPETRPAKSTSPSAR